MIPSTDIDLDDIEELTYGNKDYRLLKTDNRVVGKVEELDELKQAIYKMLNTERYQYLIYSWNYGVEVADLIGKDTRYACPILQTRIEECLTADDRIDSVDGFEFQINGNTVTATFTVHSTIGDFEEETEVEL